MRSARSRSIVSASRASVGAVLSGVEGLRIVFDPALDGAAWPGVLALQDASVGDLWCGPLGLLTRLEVVLGLSAQTPSAADRAALLARTLDGEPGFWSESFSVDRLETARRLLADRDVLALWGWTGQPMSTRLDALWNVTSRAAWGVPDRLRRVLGLLPRRSIDIASISFCENAESVPPLWRQIFEALERAGVRFDRRSLEPVEAGGDLAASRAAPFVPVGDGSLTLLRPQGPLAAAEEVAAALAACSSLEGLVIVGADAVLDAALARHGMPRLGRPRGVAGSAALVRLVVETAFRPMDPDDLHALLCMDPGPVHPRLKRRLVRALGRFPARGSAEWTKALAEGLANVEDERREGVAARFAALVDPVVPRDAELAIDQLLTRLRSLASWAHGRATSEPALRATAMLAERVIAFARTTGAAAFNRAELRRLLDEVGPFEVEGACAEVGLASAHAPGAVLGPARTIVWWNFTRASAPVAPRLRLSYEERAAFAAAAIEVPDSGRLMAQEARRWRRPLEQVSDAIVFVCPWTDEAGERAHPHPLWDEVTSTLPNPRDAAKLESPRMIRPAVARRVLGVLRPVLVPHSQVKAPALELGESESPSSLEKLLSCSLAWALERRGKLRSGLGTGPGRPSPLHYGNIAHLLLERVFATPVASPEAAAARAAGVFDAELGSLAEAMQLPDFQTHRAELRRGIMESARELARIVQATGATVKGIEVALEGELAGTKVAGRADLMLSSPDAILDFKWGHSRYVGVLEQGAAFQLVAYAALARQGAALPEIGYLTLQRQKLLGPARGTLPGARRCSDHTAEDMLAGALARLAERKTELRQGMLDAPSAIEDLEKGSLGGGVMHIAPACKLCDLGTICGRSTRL